MDDKLTHKSQDALSTAVRRAAADGSPQVDPLHLLLTLVEQADGTTAPLLRGAGARRQAGGGPPAPAAPRPGGHAERARYVPAAAGRDRHRVQPGQEARRR